MIKLIVGLKGSGKTKTLIEMVNNALETTNGSVVCIEKGNKLIHEISYRARLVDTDEYLVCDGQSLFGFVAGMSASDHDLTHIFIDSALKICKNDKEAFDTFMCEIEKFAANKEIDFVFTSSISPEDVSDRFKKYIV